MRILVCISGASGSIYGIRLIEELKRAGVEVHIIISENAKKIIEQETNYKLKDIISKADYYYENDNLLAPPASGSFKLDAIVVCPCSMKTLSSIANGYSDSLISRSASCALKEGRKLILVPRETPLDLAAIRNMENAKLAGAVILPAMPAFYSKPKKLEDLVDFIVGKILDQLNVEHSLFKRWK